MKKEELFKKRINFKGKLSNISDAVCREYNLGKLISNKLVTLGYEDFNFSIKTTKGKFFVKVFAKFRTTANCKKYVEMIEEALAKNVQTPKILKSKQGYFNIVKVNGIKLRLIVMDFIYGKTLYESKEQLNEKETKFLSKQAAQISLVKIKPKFIYDHWAIVNFLKEYNKTKKFLPANDLKLITPLLKEFRALKPNNLPHCFVHGDLIKTNIIKDKKGKLWIIDFSVSNYYPRINELAVLLCNAFYVTKNKAKTKKNFEIALKEYQKVVHLTKEEIKALPTFVKLAHTMHIIEPTYEKCKKGNKTKENEYWLKQGRIGLLQK